MRYEGKPHWARENSILIIFFFLYHRMKDVNYLTSYCDKNPNDHVVQGDHVGTSTTNTGRVHFKIFLDPPNNDIIKAAAGSMHTEEVHIHALL